MVKKDKNKVALQEYFGNKSELSLDGLRTYFKINDPEIPDATIRWRVHDLVKSSILHRVGRGLFQLGDGRLYQPELSSRSKKISTFIRKNFPDVSFCVWNSDLLNEFTQHLIAYPFVLADVERDVTESVYYQLKNNFSGVFLHPSEMLISDLLPDFRLPIIVRCLTTESPLNEESGLPLITLEKMLVDIFCDSEFTFLAGSELRSIFVNVFKKYTINENRLLRYADRKGRKQKLIKYLYDSRFPKQ
ncbi:DUF6577 family protein [Epilithonimonas sp. UC225_85]|uniref:DUF6577 family protein n=1 Tax=Epilithonimonas sp. UC225_85 TaxID=3350167 RepID=UPI0036D42DFC